MKRFDEPPPTMVSLRARLRNACTTLELAEPRAQRQLAVLVVGQMLARLEGAAAIKGATNLETRLGTKETRVSSDLDTTIAMDLTEFTESLREELREGWAGFTGTLSKPETIRAPVPTAYQPHRFRLQVQFLGRPLKSLKFEVSPDEIDSLADVDRVDPATTVPWLESLGLPAPAPMPMLRLDHQIAQKLHACTAPDTDDWTNDRVHDLVDLQLAESLYGPPDEQLQHTAARLFAARQGHPWPPTITAREGWAERYPAAAEGLPVVAGLGEAVAWGNAFIQAFGS